MKHDFLQSVINTSTNQTTHENQPHNYTSSLTVIFVLFCTIILFLTICYKCIIFQMRQMHQMRRNQQIQQIQQVPLLII